MITPTRKILSCALILVACACSSIQPDEPQNADLSITQAPTQLTFTGTVGNSSYQSLDFTNRESHDVTLNNLAFANNDCGAFSIFNIVDQNNNVVFDGENQVDIAVPAGRSVSVRLRFSPSTCELTAYSSILLLYFDNNGRQQSQSVILNATVEDNTVDVPECAPETGITYNDQIGDPTPSRKLPALPEGQSYYLKIERMRAFIQPTGGFASLATKVGSDINVADVEPDKRFTAVFLPMTSDGQGNISILEIDTCAGFSLPSPVSDPYFIGTPVTLSTPGDKTGTLNITDPALAGEINVNDLQIELNASINNSSSLLQSAEGNFRVTIEVDLTTGTTPANALLQDISDELDDEGLPLFNLTGAGSNMAMRGKHLRHGTLSLVGVGLFTDINADMSDEARKGIVENEAYIFVEITGRILTKR